MIITMKTAENAGFCYGMKVGMRRSALSQRINCAFSIGTFPGKNSLWRSSIERQRKISVLRYCYAQFTDVQQDVYGLLKENRTPKVSLEEIGKINGIDV